MAHPPFCHGAQTYAKLVKGQSRVKRLINRTIRRADPTSECTGPRPDGAAPPQPVPVLTGPRPLVGVIIPMYNATQTIDGTIASVCGQTYANLDVVIVDDGSSDDCSDKAKAWLQRDSRLRLIRQPNSGVAAARNLGAASTKADYLAFIDADDLWAPAKIETQVDVLLNSRDTVGLVYTWFAHIDYLDRVLSLKHQPAAEGWILRDLLRSNVVGNGSSAIFRRRAFEQVGGFDPTVCRSEDLAIFLRIAEHHEFRVVKRHLVGYRLLPHSRSNDAAKMMEATVAILSDYYRRYPEFSREMDEHLEELRFWQLVRAAAAGRYRSCWELAHQIWSSNRRYFALRMPSFLLAVSRARAPRSLKNSILLLLPESTRGLRSRYLEWNW